MAWSYRRRIKIIPGVYMNFSRGGISTSIGVKGANMTFGKSGTFVSTSVPLVGVYNRRKLTVPENHPFPQNHPQPVKTFDDNIFSADIQEITSQGMQGVKEAILMSYQQRAALHSDLKTTEAAIVKSRRKLKLSYILLYGLIKRSITGNIRTDIQTQQHTIEQLKEQIENCFVSLDIDWEPEVHQKYLRLVEAFGKLAQSHKIWDVTGSHYQDRVAARSSASTLVNRREVRFNCSRLLDIKSSFEVLHFQNANGADLYLYPGFIVMYSSTTSFAIVEFDEIILNQSYVRFSETDPVPPDSKIIDRTWRKVNKDGTPDRRFDGNYQIPVVKYGEFSLKTDTGLHEEYECSNYEATEQFAKAFLEYQQTIKGLQKGGK